MLGGRQAGKAPGFGPGIRRFESFPPSQSESFGAGVRDAALLLMAGAAANLLKWNRSWTNGDTSRIGSVPERSWAKQVVAN